MLVHVAVFEVGSGAAGGGALSLGPGVVSWRVIAYTVFDAVVRCDLCRLSTVSRIFVVVELD